VFAKLSHNVLDGIPFSQPFVLFSAVAVVGYMCLLVVVEIEPCGSGTDVLGLIELIVRCTGAGEDHVGCVCVGTPFSISSQNL